MDKEEKNKIQEELIKLILIHVQSHSNEEKAFDNAILSIKKLLNGHYEKYNFDIEAVANLYIKTISNNEFQLILSKLNEKNMKRKEFGVYYTPSDVTNFITYNTFINYIDSKNYKTYNINNAFKYIIQKKYSDDILVSRVFDPTCGTSEFLINALRIKINLLNSVNKKVSDAMYLNILDTLFGNDINEESIDISKIRLFFEIIKHLNNYDSYELAVKILNHNFTSYDYLIEPNSSKYEIIIGNPPYVEYNKSDNTNLRNYGNIYADVLENSIKQLSSYGAIGFVIPLSYISTTRMKGIRDYISNNTQKQIILSYADRPDCLFDGVHQKLCLIFANKGTGQHEVYTSNYKHWYNAERKTLFNSNKVIKNKFKIDKFIPKIGNQIEEQIFKKLFIEEGNSILSNLQNKNKNTLPIYLNMRACFWIKAFTFNPGSSEYKCLKVNKEIRNYILCVLNSSMFWMYWTITSDCWHITNKELGYFYCKTNNIDVNIFNTLANKLEISLENTKEYIGTKQVDYAYKHSRCKDIIDEIDTQLAKIYNLTDNQLNYIKKFALKYRSSNGTK